MKKMHNKLCIFFFVVWQNDIVGDIPTSRFKVRRNRFDYAREQRDWGICRANGKAV